MPGGEAIGIPWCRHGWGAAGSPGFQLAGYATQEDPPAGSRLPLTARDRHSGMHLLHP